MLVTIIRENHRLLEVLRSFLFLRRVYCLNACEFASLWIKCQIFEILRMHPQLVLSVSKEHKQVIADYHGRVMEALNFKI